MPVRLALVAFFLAAPLAAQTRPVVLERGIAYAEGLALDLARPLDGGPHAGIVFLHGGGWRGGDRSVYLFEILRAAEKGYVAATVSYRLTTVAPWPAQIDDARAAVRFLRANAERFHLDPTRLGASGGSAGGHLALMLALPETEPENRVQAVVNLFGPTDLARLHERANVRGLVEALLAGKPDRKADLYRDASPVAHASAGDPPILTLHGDTDEIVPLEQARLLDEAMRQAGATHTLMIFEGQGHGWQGADLDRAVTAMYEFFDRHLTRTPR